jgi:hypothetical protein
VDHPGQPRTSNAGHHDGTKNGPRCAHVFALDWGYQVPALSIEDLRFVHRLLLSVGRHGVDTALALVTAALVEHDGQHPADAEDAL